jgi:hypothetical protein
MFNSTVGSLHSVGPLISGSAACDRLLCIVHQVLLSLDCGDDWADNPVVSRSWAISWDFKEAFDEAFEVRHATEFALVDPCCQ